MHGCGYRCWIDIEAGGCNVVCWIVYDGADGVVVFIWFVVFTNKIKTYWTRSISLWKKKLEYSGLKLVKTECNQL